MITLYAITNVVCLKVRFNYTPKMNSCVVLINRYFYLAKHGWYNTLNGSCDFDFTLKNKKNVGCISEWGIYYDGKI